MRRARPWLAILAVTIVAAGAWSLQRKAPIEPGRLAPLAWLVGGVWRAEQPAPGDLAAERRFEWSSGGLVLRETRGSGRGGGAGEVMYHWDHAAREIAMRGALSDAHVEGLLRPGGDDTLELQWKLVRGAGDIVPYREQLRREGPDRLFWTRWRLIDSDLVLEHEAILVRSRR